MKRVSGFVGVLGLAVSLGACGFHPLYATPPSGNSLGMTQYYSQVLVEPIPGRQGVHLRNQLMDTFTPGGTPANAAYRLSIRLEEQKEGLAIQTDTRITRYNYNLTAKYELKDAVSGQILDRGISRSEKCMPSSISSATRAGPSLMMVRTTFSLQRPAPASSVSRTWSSNESSLLVTAAIPPWA